MTFKRLGGSTRSQGRGEGGKQSQEEGHHAQLWEREEINKGRENRGWGGGGRGTVPPPPPGAGEEARIQAPPNYVLSPAPAHSLAPLTGGSLSCPRQRDTVLHPCRDQAPPPPLPTGEGHAPTVQQIP